ncbi:Uncharacterized protein SCF082_LOCUS23006 [Durusdinium trenchii]|uniref:Glycosyltransferase RgtA/B/C/D-like domain-containing protein n=1 Tax=Durusdinium trenchii TaxID=1381693 RepID=A0ABP0LJG8_9DINO
MPWILFIAFFSIGIALRQGALMDPDTGWHIAAGDLIRAQGGLPSTDPWSHTAQDQSWYNISWAYDVVLSIVHQLGGLPAVAVFSVLLYALAVAGIAAIAMRSAQSPVAALLTTVLLGFVLLPGMLARPQGFSFLLILAFYAVLRFGRLKSLWILPVLTAVWANVHGGFLTGFVILAAFFAEAFASGRAARAVQIAGVGVLCSAAVFINPYGFDILQAVQLTMGSAMKEVLAEWRPMSLAGVSAATLFVAAFVLVSALFEKSIPLADKLLACFWLAMGLSSARMMQVAALLSAPYLAQALALRLRQSPVGAFVEAKDRAYGKDLARAGVVGALAFFAAGVVSASFLPPVQRVVAGEAEAFVKFPTHHAPDAALDYMLRHYPSIRVFNGYGFGGYMIYRERGAAPVFIDGRADTAYPRDMLADAVILGQMRSWRGSVKESSDDEWKALADRYALEGFLINVRGRLYEKLSGAPEWVEVYKDETAVLFVRASLAERGYLQIGDL